MAPVTKKTNNSSNSYANEYTTAKEETFLKMMRFLRRHPPKEGEGRESQKKELFGFRRLGEHGFPSKPSALAFDPKLKLLAIGTKTGAIRIFGAAGVEWTGQHKEDVTVAELYFLPEQGRLISQCSDNSLHLWEINNDRDGTNSSLDEVKHFVIENNKMKTVSACCLTTNHEQLLLGTEGGNILILDVKSFTLMDQIIYQDVVMQNVPDDFKVNPGAVESIAVHCKDPDKFLIGYNRGLIVLWDIKASNSEQTYNSTQQLESLCWSRSGEEFMSAHADGSYITWDAANSSEPKEPAQTPYGPFPCKAIFQMDWKTAKADSFIIFSGGMPRASYGDKHTVSIMQGQTHVVLDFTSKVIDFVTISRADENDTDEDRAEHDEPHTLLVLADEEIVAIDLDTEGWPTFQLPYVCSLHSSAITCSQHISNVPEQLWTKITDVGNAQKKGLSKREWPVTGGTPQTIDSFTRDLLLTGHEDGSVRFWDASTSCLQFLYRLTTSTIFHVDVQSPDSNGEMEEEWPPFRKVGTFDPYSDDPRLGIQKIALCPLSETLVVAGTAGQEVKSVTVNIVGDRDNFVWKGHEAVTPREGDVKYPAGYQPTCIMQLYPPAACTALAFHSEWQLVGAGTAHGFGLIDYVQKKEVTSKCTLNPDDLTGTSETQMSRTKTLKKSLRESFRRLRRRSEEVATAEAGPSTAIEVSPTTPEPKPVERSVEFRNTEDSMASMVRCLYFADTFVVNSHTHNPSLWVGTNGGHVFIYNITVPSGEKRNEDAVACILAKEIRLRHAAPVISIGVVDGKDRILPDSLEVQHERAKAPDMASHHSVIIASEEQLKIFTLPHLKAKWKFKLTAADGSRIRKVAFVNFRSRSDDNYQENDVACLSNLGELSVYSIRTLRQQVQAAAIKREDINGITSFIFTKFGQGFYLFSSSEYQRVTLSARYQGEPKCTMELAEGMRPEPPEELEPEAAGTEQGVEGPGGDAYNTGDIADALNETADSRADITMEAEVTQDSVAIIDHTGDMSVTSSNSEALVTEEASPVIETAASTEEPPTEGGDVPADNTTDDAKVEQSSVETEKVTEKVEELKISVKLADNDDPALEKLKNAGPMENGHNEPVTA
ncbi:L2GL1-like protein [Mya arenaria]|uniref:L2GL1-like protein n=1 Tax=Mya arenaria TaxID=6604 RepID=A0ABY7DGD6_MYAAR|nr:L2GL1-like protein [Mya arenaria]